MQVKNWPQGEVRLNGSTLYMWWITGEHLTLFRLILSK